MTLSSLASTVIVPWLCVLAPAFSNSIVVLVVLEIAVQPYGSEAVPAFKVCGWMVVRLFPERMLEYESHFLSANKQPAKCVKGAKNKQIDVNSCLSAASTTFSSQLRSESTTRSISSYDV